MVDYAPRSDMHNGKFDDGDPATDRPASIVKAEDLNQLFDELIAVVNAGGLTPDHETLTQLLEAIKVVASTSGVDVPWLAGFASSGAGSDLSVQLYGSVVAARAFEIVGAFGYIGTAPTGSAIEIDIQKNGVSIYTTKPSFADATGVFSAGVLDGTVAVAAGDRLDFHVSQVGATTAGQSLRFTLKGGPN